MITFDKGSIWKPINPPQKDAHGEDIGCSDCYLQLHNYVSEETLAIQPIFSLESAAGLVIAHGTFLPPASFCSRWVCACLFMFAAAAQLCQ